MKIVRTILTLSVVNQWHVHQIDLYNAFLQEDLNNEIYIELPQGFHSHGENKVCRLRKSLYGLKQSPRQWDIKITEALLKAQFQQSQFDHSLFTKKTKKELTIVLVYVDDMLITGSNLELIKETKGILQQALKMDLGELKYFFDIEFARSKEDFFDASKKMCT